MTCKTATNGSITVSASGGTAPYLYKINNGTYGITSTFTGLSAGTYSVTVKDSKGILSTINVIIKSSTVTCP